MLQYFFIELLRFASPFLIFKYPLYTVIRVTLLDGLDVEFASRGVLTKMQYQRIDKFMDNWWYIWALIYSYFHLNQYFILLFGLFCYRIIGTVFFYKKRDIRIFMLFPNFYEHAFLLFLFCMYFGRNFLLQGKILYISLLVVFLLKIVQEYWLHIAEKSIVEDVLKLYKRNWLPE